MRIESCAELLLAKGTSGLLLKREKGCPPGRRESSEELEIGEHGFWAFEIS
jgi:hypothetical protein